MADFIKVGRKNKGKMFKDRIDAALQLAEKLKIFKGKDVVVLAIPKGGLPVGAIIARALNAPLDVVLSKKIGHPLNKEYALGAVSLENMVLNKHLDIPKRYIMEETKNIRKKLQKRYDLYHKGYPPIALQDKTIIIVDDGVATGNTLKVTAELVHGQHPKKTIVAIPVAPLGAVQNLEDSNFIDKVICLETPPNFRAVGQFYGEFDQVSEAEAIQLLEELNGVVDQ